MKQMKNKKKYKTWFKEVCIGIQKIRNNSGVSSITIPKEFTREHNLSLGDNVLVFLLVRKKKLIGELEEGEVWVKMKKEDDIKYQLFKEQEKDLQSVTKSL